MDFSRHQVRTAASGNALRPRGNFSLQPDLIALRPPDAGVVNGKVLAARHRRTKTPAALLAKAGSSQGRRPPMRQAIKAWCAAHAHAAWKSLVAACAAGS